MPDAQRLHHKLVTNWVLASIIFTGALGWGLYQFTIFQQTKADIAELREDIGKTTTQWERVDRTYRDLKQTLALREAERTEAIAAIFPPDEYVTEFTRLMDTYVLKHTFANNPLFLTQMTFEKSVAPKEAFYRIVPAQVTIESSRDNFFKFLEFLEQSGSLANRVRLMDLQKISINFAEGNSVEAGREDINFSATLHTYFALAPS